MNHQKDIIKNYINEHDSYKNLNISFIEEDKPLGTIGSVKLAQNLKNDTVLIMNSEY